MVTKIEHIHKAALTPTGAANLDRRERGTLCRLVVLSLAASAAFMQCPTRVLAEDVLPAREPGTQLTEVQKPAYIPQGRQMRRYEVFARQTELPRMVATNHTLLQVGGVVNVDAARLSQLSPQHKKALAEQFRVPVGVIDQLTQQLAHRSARTADQLAREIRTAVIDYRFLQIEWDRYHPPAATQQTKVAALGALQAGDISKAWELYDGLRRPQAPTIAAPAPPTNLRVVAQ